MDFGWQRGGALYANLIDTGNSGHTISSAPGIIQTNVFQHVALTYDKAKRDGESVLERLGGGDGQSGEFYAQDQATDLLLGCRISAGGNYYYSGLLDEISLYNRALTSNEVAAIYQAGSGGKCFAPTGPASSTQPTNQTVVVGQTAEFSVSASGTAPLSYQWWFGSNAIGGQTNWTLVLNNVQLTNAGTYAVVVSNLVGSVLSSNAMLTVLVPVMIIAQPTNEAAYVGSAASFVVAASGTCRCNTNGTLTRPTSSMPPMRHSC